MQTIQSNLFYCKTTLHVSGDTAPIIRSVKTVTEASGAGHNIGPATSIQRGHVGRKQLDQYYDLYLRLRLQFLALLMMGAVSPETCRVVLQ